jgi:hypothetical protein
MSREDLDDSLWAPLISRMQRSHLKVHIAWQHYSLQGH